MSGYFVAGTDTGVGKTLVARALLHAFAARGKSVVGMKPVAAGCDDSGCEDAILLRRASSVQAPEALVNPYAFRPAIAPHIAAHEAGVVIELERIQLALRELRALAEVVVVEGVGGFRVPLNGRADGADLARMLGLPVVLVVGLRLGCLSHALLTAESIAARGLPLAGWVANHIDPGMARREENLEALRQRLPAPLLGVAGYDPQPDPVRLSRALICPDSG